MAWDWKPGDWACCIANGGWTFAVDGKPADHLAPAQGEILHVIGVKAARNGQKPPFWQFWKKRSTCIYLTFQEIPAFNFEARHFRKLPPAKQIQIAMRSRRPKVEA